MARSQQVSPQITWRNLAALRGAVCICGNITTKWRSNYRLTWLLKRDSALFGSSTHLLPSTALALKRFREQQGPLWLVGI